jgi:hypothetical protein
VEHLDAQTEPSTLDQVAARQNADQPPLGFNDRQRSQPLIEQYFDGLGERRIGAHDHDLASHYLADFDQVADFRDHPVLVVSDLDVLDRHEATLDALDQPWEQAIDPFGRVHPVDHDRQVLGETEDGRSVDPAVCAEAGYTSDYRRTRTSLGPEHLEQREVERPPSAEIALADVDADALAQSDHFGVNLRDTVATSAGRQWT